MIPSGYKSSGVDFDDLFDPYVEGNKPGLTGYKSNGVDLRDRYAPISYGSKRADVGFKVGGQDVSNLWAAKGTAVYILNAIAQSVSATGASMSASVSIYPQTDGHVVADAIGTATTDATANVGTAEVYQYRARGTVSGQRMAGSATAKVTGKGGVNITIGSPSSSGHAFDTGFHNADNATPLVTFSTTSPPNAALAQVLGMVYIDVRRVSDGQTVRTLQFDTNCQSDSQS